MERRGGRKGKGWTHGAAQSGICRLEMICIRHTKYLPTYIHTDVNALLVGRYLLTISGWVVAELPRYAATTTSTVQTRAIARVPSHHWIKLCCPAVSNGATDSRFVCYTSSPVCVCVCDSSRGGSARLDTCRGPKLVRVWALHIPHPEMLLFSLVFIISWLCSDLAAEKGARLDVRVHRRCLHVICNPQIRNPIDSDVGKEGGSVQ